MRGPFPRSLLFLLTIAALGACGDAESALPPVPPTQAPGASDPWAQIPADSLYGATAVENLEVTPVTLDVARLPAGWEGMRVAAISDFQLGLWPDNEDVATAAVRRAAALDVDLIVLLGDYLHTGADTLMLGRVLAPLRGKKVFAVLGDRDIRTDSMEALITRTLSAQGIQVLRNSAAPFTRNGSTASVGGVDPGMAADSWGEQEYLLAIIGQGSPVPLLLTHLPALASRIPEDRYSAILAGNTFCGQVEVPGTPRLSWLNTAALPGAVVREVPRLYRVEGATMYVTCGVGYSFVPLRLGAPPEVALVTLRSPAAPPADSTAPAAGRDSVSIDTLLQRFGGAADTTAPADTTR